MKFVISKEYQKYLLEESSCLDKTMNIHKRNLNSIFERIYMSNQRIKMNDLKTRVSMQYCLEIDYK